MRKTILAAGAAAIVFVGLAVATCDRFRRRTPVGAGPDRPEIRHVILITIDALRADVLPFHGNRGIATPNLTRLAEHGILFERALAPSPWTRPSITSILTGLPPSVHAAVETAVDKEVVLPDTHPTLAECMLGAGYRTAAMGYNPFLAFSPNAKRGFEEYSLYPVRVVSSDGEETPCHSDTSDWTLDEPGAPEVDEVIVKSNSTYILTEIAKKWLAGNADEKFFFWLHYYDPHKPYMPPIECYRRVAPHDVAPDDRTYAEALRQTEYAISKFLDLERKRSCGEDTEEDRRARETWHRAVFTRRNRIRSLYEAEVVYVDLAIGQLLDTLERHGIYDDALIVVTSDHGEEFFDHDGLEHGHTLYQELLHVPLIVKLPGHEPARRVRQRVSIQGLSSTILDLCSVAPPPTGLPSPSLTPQWESPAPETSTAVLFAGDLMYGDPGSSVLFGDMKYIRRGESREEELYDLASDPTERVSLVDREPTVLARAREILEAHTAWCRSFRKRVWTGGVRTTEQDEEARRLLRAHGYLK